MIFKNIKDISRLYMEKKYPDKGDLPDIKIPIKLEVFNKTTGQYELKKVTEYPVTKLDLTYDDPLGPRRGKMIRLNTILGLYDVCVYRFEQDETGHHDKYITTVFADGEDLSKHREPVVPPDYYTPYGFVKYHENIDLVVKFKEPEPEKPKPPVKTPECTLKFYFMKPRMSASDPDNLLLEKSKTVGLGEDTTDKHTFIDRDTVIYNLIDILNNESSLKRLKATKVILEDTDILTNNINTQANQDSSYTIYISLTNVEYDKIGRPSEIRIVGDEYMVYADNSIKLMYMSNPCFNSDSNTCKIKVSDIHKCIEHYVDREAYGLDDPELPPDEKDEIQFFDTITVHYIDNTKDLVIESLDRTNMASTEIDTSKINYISCLEK